jgi:UDP-N-acetylmuramyl tripeptide synthase
VLSRRIAGRDGTVIGGRLALLADPLLIERWAADRRVAVVSGTNGKTTTTALLAAALASRWPVASNADGANLPTGIATAVVTGYHLGTGAFEVDEAFVPWALHALRPEVVVLLNLSRDQLDRLHEVRSTAARWRDALAGAHTAHVVANADDPLVVWAASDAPVIWVAAGQPWRLDAGACPACAGEIRFASTDWWCRGCSLRRPAVDVTLAGDMVVAPDGEHTLPVALPGRCNRANAAMALVAAMAMGVDADAAVSNWPSMTQIASRFSITTRGGSSIRLLMAKNPAGWLEVLEMLDDPSRTVVLVLNARPEDGTDPSWIWDVAFERLAGRAVVCAGERAADLSARLTYAGIDHTVQPGPLCVDALVGDVDVVANYSAFRQVARRLARAA